MNKKGQYSISELEQGRKVSPLFFLGLMLFCIPVIGGIWFSGVIPFPKFFSGVGIVLILAGAAHTAFMN